MLQRQLLQSQAYRQRPLCHRTWYLNARTTTQLAAAWESTMANDTIGGTGFELGLAVAKLLGWGQYRISDEGYAHSIGFALHNETNKTLHFERSRFEGLNPGLWYPKSVPPKEMAPQKSSGWIAGSSQYGGGVSIEGSFWIK